MILVADSGSTKADWFLADDSGKRDLHRTKGLNPFLHSEEVIESVLNGELVPHLDLSVVNAVYFYGAGCSDTKRISIMERGLQRVFPTAELHVEHDLLAAARATCGHASGVACILGTGSNSCLYDGTRILDNVTSLGYLVGDEGSGCDLGKALVRAYFYREMPAEVHRLFHEEIANDKVRVMDEIYGPHPNVYLASLAEFITRHLEHDFLREMAKASFRNFIQRHVLKYTGADNYPIHFVGSIAFHFQDLIREVLDEIGLLTGEFVRKPIARLVDYHLEPDFRQNP